MKVLHLIKTSVGAKWALRQMQSLVKLGLEVHVALPDGPMVKDYRDAKIQTHVLQTSLNVRNPLLNPRIAGNLKRLVEITKPEIIHSHFFTTTMMMRLALGSSGPKRIFHVPGPLHLEHFFFRTLDLTTSKRNDYWLASCDWTRDCYLAAGVSPHRVGLVYYGTALDEFENLPQGILRSEYNIAKDVPIIGNVAFFYKPKWYLGQTRGLKGHEDLIDAIEIVVKQKPIVRCVFIGGPWGTSQRYMEKVIRYAKRKLGDQIIFTGYRDDVKSLYRDFTIAVHPSLSENVGGAAESMLCGVPTITTDIGGFPDIVKPNRTGWLVPPNSPSALAETILLALSDHQLSRDYAEAGRDLAKKKLDVHENAKTLVSFYEKILIENV